MEKEEQDWGRGGKCRQDCNCTFHSGFHSVAKTIAALESQVCFHAKVQRRSGTPEWKKPRGQIATEKPLPTFPYNRTFMWWGVFRGQCQAQSTKEALSMIHSAAPPAPLLLSPPNDTTYTNELWKQEVKWRVWNQGSALQAMNQFRAITAQIWIVGGLTLHQYAEKSSTNSTTRKQD